MDRKKTYDEQVVLKALDLMSRPEFGEAHLPLQLNGEDIGGLSKFETALLLIFQSYSWEEAIWQERLYLLRQKKINARPGEKAKIKAKIRECKDISEAAVSMLTDRLRDWLQEQMSQGCRNK